MGCGAVEVVRELKAEETGGVKVQRDLVVLADSGDEGVEVIWVTGEDEGVVDVYDDVCCLGWGNTIEEALVEL